MRVVSLVPSWTETLIEAGVDVIGRTRFCIHPSAQVQGIPVVGGTKDWKLAAIRELAPDLIILDQEENPKFMAEQSPAPYLSSHITKVESVSEALAQMAVRLRNPELIKLSVRWAEIVKWQGLTRWSVGEGILMPALNSIISEKTERHERMVAYSIAAIAIGIGEISGNAFGVNLFDYLASLHKSPELFAVLSAFAFVFAALVFAAKFLITSKAGGVTSVCAK